MLKVTLQAIIDAKIKEASEMRTYLARGIYEEPVFVQGLVDRLDAEVDLLRSLPTTPNSMMEDASAFADTYMLGDGMSDKFLFARLAKLSEEVSELATAAAADDEYEIADALVDIVYVALVTAAKRGHPFSKLWDDVHKSNMTKTPKGAGKFGASKGVGFVPADTKAIMIDAGF